MSHIPSPEDERATHHNWLIKASALAHAPVEEGGSPHPSVKVGAIIVDSQNQALGQASNGFAPGVDGNRVERFDNGLRSLWINCSEQMALAQVSSYGYALKGAKIYVTLEPCAICAGLLVASGIQEVIVPLSSRRFYAQLKDKWKTSIEIGTTKLTEAGVKITMVDMQDVKGFLPPDKSFPNPSCG
ncbi:MAG: deaminase [Alphaproteobacteria bacterium]|nr:deaminase [Alphaproteobacteria bacterium]